MRMKRLKKLCNEEKRHWGFCNATKRRCRDLNDTDKNVGPACADKDIYVIKETFKE